MWTVVKGGEVGVVGRGVGGRRTFKVRQWNLGLVWEVESSWRVSNHIATECDSYVYKAQCKSLLGSGNYHAKNDENSLNKHSIALLLH